MPRKKTGLPTPEFDLDIVEKEEYHFPSLPTDDQELFVFRVAHELWGPGMHMRGAGMQRQILIYIVRGKGRFLTTRGEVDVGSSMVLVYGGPEPFSVRTAGNRMEVYIVPCGGRNSAGIFRTLLGFRRAAYQLAEPFAVRQLFELQFDEARRRSRHARDICAHYAHIILRRIADEQPPRNMRMSQALASFDHCRNFLQTNFSEIAGIHQAATACGLTQEYLTRLFQRYEKMSPYEYLTRLKLNKACHLLLTSGRPVHEIAEATGYADPYSFSRAFKRVLGMAPAHYRRLNPIDP
jgi:AraC-like DNA-binding protein